MVERYTLRCHSYCLMSNHYHLLLETPQANLPIAMRQLNGLYARRFNLRYGLCGHVFQARYRSILVEKESHLLSVARYIELNPVRAGICEDPGDYVFSSYRAHVGLADPPPFLTSDWILSQLAPTRSRAQERYRAFVAEGAREPAEGAVRGERLGGEPFLRERFGIDPPLAEIPRAQIEPLAPSLEEILARHPAQPVLVAYRRHGYTLGQIAEFLGCSYSTVSRRLNREEEAERAMRECKT